MLSSWNAEHALTAAWPSIAAHLKRALDAGDATDDLVAYVSEAADENGERAGLDIGVVSRTTAREVFSEADDTIALLHEPAPAGHVWIVLASQSGAVVVAVDCSSVLHSSRASG